MWWLEASWEGRRRWAGVSGQGLSGQEELVRPKDLLIVHNEELDELSLVCGIQQAGDRSGTCWPWTVGQAQIQCPGCWQTSCCPQTVQPPWSRRSRRIRALSV